MFIWTISRKRSRDRYRRAAREAALDKHGRKCARCGFSNKIALQFDHVNGHGTRETGGGFGFFRDVLNDNSGKFQLLCSNCNWIKREEMGEQNQWRIDEQVKEARALLIEGFEAWLSKGTAV